MELDPLVSTHDKNRQLDILLLGHDIDDDASIIESSLREVIVKRCILEIFAKPKRLKCDPALTALR